MTDSEYEDTMRLPNPAEEISREISGLEKKVESVKGFADEARSRFISKEGLVVSAASIISTVYVSASFDACSILTHHLTLPHAIYTRVWSAAGTLVMGPAYNWVRDGWRKWRNVEKKSSEKKQGGNDTIYSGLYNVVTSPLPYFIGGTRGLVDIAVNSLLQGAAGLFQGGIKGFAIDAGKDAAEIDKCERPLYVRLMQNKNPQQKRRILALASALSIALTTGIYDAADSMASRSDPAGQPQIAQIEAVPRNYLPTKRSLEYHVAPQEYAIKSRGLRDLMD